MKVGVVVPIYNVAPFLAQCLDSIINQTYPHLEIILVNDGSTDSSLRIAKEYAQKDSRITIVDKANGGLSSARNAGIEFFTSARFKVMDLRSAGEFANANARHESRCDSCNDEKTTTSSLQGSGVEDTLVSRHCEAVRKHNEAIYNQAKSGIYNGIAKDNGEIQDYRLPRDSSESLAMTQSPSPRDDAEALHSYGIIGENPYQIYAIYSLKSSLEIPQIDYLQFVDSDDYIELDCVEQCVKRMQGVDVLWFNTNLFYDKCDVVEHITNMEYYHYKKEQIITSKEWLKKSQKIGLGFFWYSYHGLINFAFLKSIKLKFINGIIHEDNIFGILLFANATKIYVYPKNYYHYRIRPNSIMNFSGTHLESSPPPKHLSSIYDAFERLDEAKAYHKAYSWYESALSLNEFLKHNKDKYQNKLLKECFLKTFCLWALSLENFPSDPLNVKTKENLRFLKKNARGFINAFFFGGRKLKNNKKIVKIESINKQLNNKVPQ